MKAMPGILVLAMASGLVLTGARAADIDQQRPASPDARITVLVPRGEVAIRGWDRPVLAVIGELKGDARSIELSGPQDRPHLEVIHHDPDELDGDAELEIMVPEHCRLNVTTVDADIWIDGCRDAVMVTSITGELRLDGEPRSVMVDQMSGNVFLDVPADSVMVSCVDGDIYVSQARQSVRCLTYAGDVTVMAGPELARLHVESLAGDALVSGGLTADTNWSISLQDGDALLAVDDDPDAQIRLTTMVGDVVCRLAGMEDRKKTRAGTVKTVRFRVGRGRGSVAVDVLSGDVVVKGRRGQN